MRLPLALYNCYLIYLLILSVFFDFFDLAVYFPASSSKSNDDNKKFKFSTSYLPVSRLSGLTNKSDYLNDGND